MGFWKKMNAEQARDGREKRHSLLQILMSKLTLDNED
jgi:hypothetical protein